MSTIVMCIGKRYRLLIQEVDTGEQVGEMEGYYYGTSVPDSTDFIPRFSVFPPAIRDSVRDERGLTPETVS